MLSNKEYSRLKGRLTRAINSDDPDKVMAEVDYAYSVFDANGPWPDGWSRWQRARDDAEFRKIRESPWW